jgi:hypothetical protein
VNVKSEVAFGEGQKQKYKMKKRNKDIQRLLAVGVLALAATAAQATIETETITVAPSLGGSGGLTFSLPTFDPSLGTLNGVELTLTPVLGSAGSSDVNLSGSPVTISGATVAFNGVGSLQNSGLGMTATYQTLSGVLDSPDYVANGFPPPADGPALPFVWTTVDSSAALSDAAYAALGGSAAFTGTGITGTYSFPDVPNNYIGGYYDLGGSLEVDFNYTPVPEPATIISGLLMVLPCGASALRILRRRQVS